MKHIGLSDIGSGPSASSWEEQTAQLQDGGRVESGPSEEEQRPQREDAAKGRHHVGGRSPAAMRGCPARQRRWRARR